jgi:membrane protein YqaA with SNARE-associated domain
VILQSLSLLGVAFVGTVFWVVSPEAAAIYYGAELGWNPLLVGATIAVGQIGMYAILYHGGEVMVQRWRWLHGKVMATRTRFLHHMERNYLILAGVGSTTGIPPIVALMALASGFGIPARAMLPVTIVGRTIRFTTLAAAGELLLAWWRAL